MSTRQTNIYPWPILKVIFSLKWDTTYIPWLVETIKFLIGGKNCLYPELLYLIKHKRTSPHAFPSALCPSFSFLEYSTSFLENLYHHVHKRDGCKRKLITK